MSEFNNLSPSDLAILSSIVALAIAKDRSTDDINVLGNFVAAVGTILLTIAAQQQKIESRQDKQNNNQTIG